MPKKSTKSKSKRKTLHQKYKIIKKVKEHKKKKAKEIKKLGGRVKGPKDPGIPSAWPFKEQLLKEIEMAKIKEVRSASAARRLPRVPSACSPCCREAHRLRSRRRVQDEAKLKRKEAAKERKASLRVTPTPCLQLQEH